MPSSHFSPSARWKEEKNDRRRPGVVAERFSHVRSNIDRRAVTRHRNRRFETFSLSVNGSGKDTPAPHANSSGNNFFCGAPRFFSRPVFSRATEEPRGESLSLGRVGEYYVPIGSFSSWSLGGCGPIDGLSGYLQIFGRVANCDVLAGYGRFRCYLVVWLLFRSSSGFYTLLVTFM